MCFYWILLGLVYLATIIQDVSDAFQEKVEKFDEKAASVKCKISQVADAMGPGITDENGRKQEQGAI